MRTAGRTVARTGRRASGPAPTAAPERGGVSHPVGLDHTPVERIVKTVAGGEQLQVGPGTFEAGSQLSEAGDVGALGRGAQEGGRVARPAVPE